MNPAVIEFFNVLPNRTIIEVSGVDRATFLQGLITNDIKTVEKELIIYTLMLSPQGKFQYDFFIINIGSSLLIDIDSKRADTLIQRLQLFKLHALITITKNTDIHIGVSSRIVHTNYCFEDPRLKNLGYRWYGKILSQAQTLVEVYENLRLTLGVPDGARDLVVDKSIPLEWGMDELKAISWGKGCYMGQELTARSRYVGQVRKRAFVIESQDLMDLEIGTKLQVGDREVGELRTHNGTFGIALLRLEAALLPNVVTIENKPVKIHQPSWMKLPE
jgi:folate-binding protein YgfZ